MSFARRAFASVALAYGAVVGHIAFDYVFRTLPAQRRGDSQHLLQVEHYRLTIGGEQNVLALAGEFHHYARSESEAALRLVTRYPHIATECGSDPFSAATWKTNLFMTGVSLPLLPSTFFYVLGSGRTYPSISDFAEGDGRVPYSLEDVNTLADRLTLPKKAALISYCVGKMITAPLSYYEGVRLGRGTKEYDGPLKCELVLERDAVMARSILGLLADPEIDSLLAAVGQAHQRGIVASLDSLASLEALPPETPPPPSPTR